MGRREMREHIFKLLFLGELNETEEMPEQIQLYFEGLSDLQPADFSFNKTSISSKCSFTRVYLFSI